MCEDRLPVNLRGQFASAAAFTEGDGAEQWTRRTRGLFALVEGPKRALAALDKTEHRRV